MAQHRIRGTFIDKNESNTYYVQIGNIGSWIDIKDGSEYDPDDTECIYFGDEPVIITSDTSDTFEHVYSRQCSINLICNYDVRPLLISKNYADIPVEIRYNNAEGTIIFSGYVSPLSFNQSYAYNYNEFQLDCFDKLGTLEYVKIKGDNVPYIDIVNYGTPKYFINEILGELNLDNVIYDIEYDHTIDTKINPQIFLGDSEDDWMNRKEVLEEIGKIYGCYFWQDGNTCRIENLLLYDTDDPVSIGMDDYQADDTNISIDQAYNIIKCTVDISSMDETFINPFDDENIELLGQYSERVMTELLYKNKDSKWGNLEATRNLYDYAYGDPYIPGATPIINWYTLQNTTVENENCEIYDNYAQVIKNKMFDFHSEDHTDITGDPTYLDFTTWDDSDEGEHSKWSRATNTLKWLWQHPGRGAFMALGKTNNLTNWKNRERPQLKDMKNYLLIQLNWTRTDADYGGSGLNEQTRRQNIFNTIGTKLSNACPVCTLTINESKNLVPSDASTVNYLVFSGKIRLNPIVARTGPNGKFTWDNYNVWSFWERGTKNNISNALAWWENNWNNTNRLWFPNKMLKGCCVYKDDDDDGVYYNTYGWNNRRGGWDQQSGIIYKNWPYNAKNPDFTSKMAYPYLSPNYEMWKYEQSRYERSGSAAAVDAIEKLAILACELKIGDKYLVEDLNMLDQQTWSMGNDVYNDTYKWLTYEECPEKNGVKQTWFTIGINPGIGDNIIGKEFEIQNTVEIFMNLDAKGLAIPIRYSDNLNGQVTFKILGPYNIIYENKKCKHYWEPFRRVATTVNEGVPLLAYLENIIISDFKMELHSVNINGTSQQNTDNDLVYSSDESNLYTDEQEYDCKFCTALSSEEAADMGVDYALNNSAIVDLNDDPWLGMSSYEGQSAATGAYIKLEECRVSEQYNLWKRPRNIIETTIKLTDPEKGVDKTNYKFGYLTYDNDSEQVYRTTTREINLKQNTMTCTMKEISDPAQ